MSDQLSIISSEVMEMFYEPDNFLIIQRWKGGGLDEEKFKQTILQVNEQGERMANMGMKVFYEIIVPQFSFMVPPDLQEWAAEQTKEVIKKVGLQKIAVVIPTAVQEQLNIEALSVEQTVEEMAKIGVAYRIVGSEAEARGWFLET
ncbi:MAG: hypothetical protein KatS3mg033_0874 [Thermonema sp.]|uniref:hypothetical protein n=1 Tax=Thermonema sp. TaxID=2231181 RepID=UPI0021DDF16B|nr:hypothetical protein [Thermonema sp.]GIV39074.1 MAG: hypothetical protein KatS3mg033_0874 [Thermonema sp.]